YIRLVDDHGIYPTMYEPDNHNGSRYANEGLTSPDGHVLGKMGHSERTMGNGKNGSDSSLIKNIAGFPVQPKIENSCQNIFAAGVSYFN
ncbi:MAG: phosphoribosylformylglycinamidine synthase subunit PurQ, partial [Treponema sp.]|nr:phosphoribosylformylglycinamidine synthase subunit PurQ [Treponema sp.]